jgi:hypothetical protein|tara:strand:+ start:219 stop:392 length:174 start_codon:yes stop_codon:yes gene_type:complete
MPRWELILIKELGNIVVDTFKTKQQADKEIEYRNSLCRHMGYEPDLTYKLREVKEKQ